MGDATAGDDGSDDGSEDNDAAAGEGQQSSNDSAPDSDSGTPSTDVSLGGSFTDATEDEDEDEDDPPPQFGTPDSMLGVAPGRGGVDTNPYTDDIAPPLDDGIYAMPPYFDLAPEDKAGPIPVTPLDIQPGLIPNPPGNPDPLLGYPPFYQDILLPGLPAPPPAPIPPFPTGLFVIGGSVLAGIVGITVGYWLGLNNPAVGNFYGIAPGSLGLPPAGPPSPFALLNQDYLEGNAA